MKGYGSPRTVFSGNVSFKRQMLVVLFVKGLCHVEVYIYGRYGVGKREKEKDPTYSVDARLYALHIISSSRNRGTLTS